MKEAKEKAENDKKEKMARKKQLVDLSKDDDQVGTFTDIDTVDHQLHRGQPISVVSEMDVYKTGAHVFYRGVGLSLVLYCNANLITSC